MGAAGISELHPVVECFRPDHPFFFDVYREIINCGMFIISHSSDHGFSKASHWEPVCKKFPNLKLILAHINKDSIELLKNYENVFVDTSATFLRCQYDISELDTKRIFLGSDYPYVEDLPEQIKKIETLNLPQASKEDILYHNFNRVFKDFI